MKGLRYTILIALVASFFNLNGQACDISKCTPEQIAKCCPPSCDITTASPEEIAKCCPWMADDFDMEAFKAKCASMTDEEKAACKIACGMKPKHFKKKRGRNHDAFFMKHAGKGKGHLGVVFQDEAPDNIISEVKIGTAAEQYKMEVGDQIISINGTQTNDYESIVGVLGNKRPGDTIELVFMRNGKEETKNIELRRKRDYANVDWTLRGVRSCNPDVKTAEQPEVRTEPTLSSSLLSLNSFNAYPNPASDFIQLNFEGEALPTGISVIDITGKIIYRESISNFSGTFDKIINLDGATGMVAISVSQEDKVFTHKVILTGR